MIVTGTARLMEIEQIGVAADAVFDEPWPPEVRTSIIGLPPKDVLLVKNHPA